MKHAPITNITRMGGQPVERRRVSPRHMAVPKPAGCIASQVPGLRDSALSFAICKLAPSERLALEFMAHTANLVEVEGCAPYLLIPTTPALLDVLAALGAAAMDREPDTDYEPDTDREPATGDDEPDHAVM